MRSILSGLAIVAAVLAMLTGCSDSDSPTVALPATRALNGTFAGELPNRIPGEDWSVTTLELATSPDRSVSGTVTPKSGPTRPVGGTYSGANVFLVIGGLPQEHACYEIEMNVYRFEFDSANQVTAFEGSLTGRCQGTMSGRFRMERK